MTTPLDSSVHAAGDAEQQQHDNGAADADDDATVAADPGGDFIAEAGASTDAL